MYLTMKCISPQGIPIERAVCRVEAITLPAERSNMSFALRRYAVPEGVPFFQEDYFEAPYVAGAGDAFAQAYKYLMGLPEFADVVIQDREGETTS